jgi:hypothetical protein
MRTDQTHGLCAGGARENVDPLAGNKHMSIRFSLRQGKVCICMSESVSE